MQPQPPSKIFPQKIKKYWKAWIPWTMPIFLACAPGAPHMNCNRLGHAITFLNPRTIHALCSLELSWAFFFLILFSLLFLWPKNITSPLFPDSYASECDSGFTNFRKPPSLIKVSKADFGISNPQCLQQDSVLSNSLVPGLPHLSCSSP